MTRPNIVRADTIDLQDEEHPSASGHHKPSLQNGLAPHQRAEVDHVMEERNSEEHALADAWHTTGDLTEEPDSIDQAQQQSIGQPSSNGGEKEGEDDGEGDGEGDADDDMMDRISSSPSIDDGGYLLHSSPPSLRRKATWPVRTSSLTPSPRATPIQICGTFNQSASSTPTSSPFLQTPQHLPLHVRRTGKEASPLVQQLDSSSPFDLSPKHLPLAKIEQSEDSFSFTSKNHHHSMGRYKPSPEPTRVQESRPEIHNDCRTYFPEGGKYKSGFKSNDEGFDLQQDSPLSQDEDEESSDSSMLEDDVDPTKRPIESPFRSNPLIRDLNDFKVPKLEQSASLTSIGSVDLQDVLLPVDDPLLDIPPSPTNSSGSWESLPEDEDRDMNDDDKDAFFQNSDDRFIDSGYDDKCLQESEEIDFQFVYALHTFVATVEGQANATKGDTMVLLDDSNSYWWLVRVVKDNSIGYLPAEHIETPTERLARLNKHRNIDLSATMLSDNSEKSRNPLKKAMRRRNAKTVQFAAPTYVEPSDYGYDTEDEETETIAADATSIAPSEATLVNGENVEEESAADKGDLEDGTARSSTPTRNSFDREQAATLAGEAEEDPQLSPKLVDKTEAAPLKSRKTRNTDSFLKDDNNETRKITITPGLLREEGNKASTSSDSARNDSLENLVKQISPPELSKKDSKKEKKEKKGGMLSGLFKRSKKSKDDGSEPSDTEKRSGEFNRQSPRESPLTSGRTSPILEPSSVVSANGAKSQEPQTKQAAKGKLQKLVPSSEGSSPVREREPTIEQGKELPAGEVAELQGSEAAHEIASSEPEIKSTELALPEKAKEGPLSPIANILLGRDDSKSVKPTKVKKAKQRVELDDFDSPEAADTANPFEKEGTRDAESDEEEEEEEGDGRLSESPIEITHPTYMHGTESVHIPTPGPYDQPGVEGDDDDDEEPESLSTSPSIIDHPAEPVESQDREIREDNDLTPTGPRSPQVANASNASAVSSSAAAAASSAIKRGLSTDSTATSSSNRLSPAITNASQQSWSDSSLRAWLEDGSEVKDMMVMIHDKSGVVPVSSDHPMMAGLFAEPKKGVQDMMGELDGLLGSYLKRKGIALG